MKSLSPTAEAIRQYKLNASGGYEERSKVSCTENYRMHVPSMEFDVSGPAEIQEVIFGWLDESSLLDGSLYHDCARNKELSESNELLAIAKANWSNIVLSNNGYIFAE